jgi:hypothetical protein
MTHSQKGYCSKGEGVGPTAKGQQKRSVHEQFLFFVESANATKLFAESAFIFRLHKFIFCCKLTTTRKRAGEHMFHSIPFTPRKVEATESRLKAVYDAAKLGLKGDALALAAGMLPIEYRQLTQLDPVVELAAQKGKADGEIELSQVLHAAAKQGDAKAALEILKHQHGWVAKQAISVEVDQRISITGALAEAQKRALEVIDAEVIETQINAIDHIQR